MAYIKNLTALNTLQAGDNLAVGSTSNGDDRRAPVSVLASYLQDNLTFIDSLAFPNFITQYDSPSATGFTTRVTDNGDNIFLIMTPSAGYASGTIILPAVGNLVDKQEILIVVSEAVTALTINGNGATVNSAPTTLVADSFLRFRYDLLNTTWYLIGYGSASAQYTESTTSTPNTLALRDSNADLTSRVFISTVATGTAPLTVASTTAVSNLNADQTDGYDASELDTASTLAARDSNADVQANAFESTVATGTAPLTVASTTVVSNLNVDSVDGYDAATTSTPNSLAARDISANLTANVMISDVSTGTPPFIATSTTKCTNLNVEQVDGFDAQIADGPSVIPVRDPNGNLNAGFFMFEQGAEAAKTTSTTLTAAEISTKMITVNNGGGAATNLTLPTAAAMDIEFDQMGNDQAFDFTVLNISTVSAEDCTILTNTGWTLTGRMQVDAAAGTQDNPVGTFRARKTGTGAWTLYRSG